jgi:hypothetical protein
VGTGTNGRATLRKLTYGADYRCTGLIQSSGIISIAPVGVLMARDHKRKEPSRDFPSSLGMDPEDALPVPLAKYTLGVSLLRGFEMRV